MSFFKNPMRAIMAGVLATTLASGSAAAYLPPLPPTAAQREQQRQRRTLLKTVGQLYSPRPYPKSRTHTGGGPGLAHRIWKRRRASGRA